MKKKVAKYALIVVFIILAILAIFNTYKWNVCGNQNIKISTSTKAFTNSDLYVSIIAQENGVDLDTKTEIKLLDCNGKKVKNVEISYDENNAIISIPEVETGNYIIEAKVSSEAGKDTIQKEIYITDGNQQNITITLDKGIYKPGDTVNFRALITNKDNDEPIETEANICIYDGNDNKVYNETVKASEYGIMSGTFTLSDEVNSGIYKLVVKTNTNETTKQFKVNPYVTPKYEVNIDFDKTNYLVGDTATININSKYFFGEAVSNAKYEVYVNGESYKTATADEKGNATVSYKIKDAKTYTIKVEAVDKSNYYVEESSSFTAGTDIFEVELLPEYGNLIAGQKNNIYVFTKKQDGTPLKTYVTISSGNFTKQIATDENGIGMFPIDIDNTVQTSTYSYYNINTSTRVFKITAENMDGEKVQKQTSLTIETKNLLLSTDKVKYNQGEDIVINASSISENTKNIYIFKNDKLIKMVTTDSSETKVNLEDVYGLIDIYVTQNGNTRTLYTYGSRYNTNSCKRTIFIEPTKKLNINISTDKQEYEPGENITISFGTTDEKNNNVDSALLVSMLDNSILSLADNDLSIDNIRLALSDIEFSNELDGATLYSCIVNDLSEQTMMGLLLKQSDSDINVSETSIKNYEEEEKAQAYSIISIIIMVIMIFAYLYVKFPKFKIIMKHILNVLLFIFIVTGIIICLIDEFFWRTVDYSLWKFIATVIICIATYMAWISKFSNKISKTSISILLSSIIVLIGIVLADISDLAISIFWVAIALVILILVILLKVMQGKQLNNKFVNNMPKKLLYICKFIGAVIVSVIIGAIIEEISNIYHISIPVSILCIYLFNYLFNKVGKNDKLNEEFDKNEKGAYIRDVIIGVVITLAIIGALAIVYIVYDQAKYTIDDAILSETVEDTTISGNSGGISLDDISPNTSDSKGTISSIINGADSFLSTDNSNKETTTTTQSTENTTTIEKEVDSNIRNVFLESMCFIPELVTTDGKASLDLTLSDNITTWTIQTVGNTTDGKIGYGILDTVKVTKEFFVDFELPTNLVDTDKVSIPVTVYNYTDKQLKTTLKVKEDEWFTTSENSMSITVEAQSTKMVYIPINIKKSGDYKFRVEATSNSLTDIVEKQLTISPKGYKVEKVVSTGNLDGDITEDLLILEDTVENTASAKVKIYASTMAQTVEGMENIFKMPTGCFEQVSSSLYPNILALKYLEDNGIFDEEIEKKALNYISSGYQKLLTYEVKGESGGYSLYGYSPAETVLTAYGLMELTDLSEVYNVDEKVIKEMKDFLYGKQNANGTFTITGNHIGGASSRDTLALNAYITWALSESDPENANLAKSVEYLKEKIDDVDDNYTLALIANILANVGDKQVNDVMSRLVSNININGNNAYITSTVKDYYGTRGNAQTIQTVALTSMALSKTSYNTNTNKQLINYLISAKDMRGTWYSTQATILSLKALNELNENNKLDNQTITVRVNSDEQKIEIKDNSLDYYEVSFENLVKENKLSIDIESGSGYYEVVEEYYIPYENVDTSEDEIEVNVSSNNILNVNDILKANIKLINRSTERIYNGMVTISIPQGFTVVEDSLITLQSKGIIEKYETSYTEVNIYLRNFEISQIIDLDVDFRASYPVEVTGLAVRAYDYYNPEVEGRSLPTQITVKK